MGIHIDVVDEPSIELLKGVNRLIPQLSTSAPALTFDELRTIVANDATRLLVARTGDSVVGILTLLLVPLPTGRRARIEDVVVDEGERGRQVGRRLTEDAINLARAEGAKTVDLTSRPAREAANHLYRALGFEPRDSMTYRLNL